MWVTTQSVKIVRLVREKRPLNAPDLGSRQLPWRFYDDSRRAFLQAIASAAFKRIENRVQLELLERASIAGALERLDQTGAVKMPLYHFAGRQCAIFQQVHASVALGIVVHCVHDNSQRMLG